MFFLGNNRNRKIISPVFVLLLCREPVFTPRLEDGISITGYGGTAQVDLRARQKTWCECVWKPLRANAVLQPISNSLQSANVTVICRPRLEDGISITGYGGDGAGGSSVPGKRRGVSVSGRHYVPILLVLSPKHRKGGHIFVDTSSLYVPILLYSLLNR